MLQFTYLYIVYNQIENVGVEPLFSIPNAVCYRYTTFSVNKTQSQTFTNKFRSVISIFILPYLCVHHKPPV